VGAPEDAILNSVFFGAALWAQIGRITRPQVPDRGLYCRLVGLFVFPINVVHDYPAMGWLMILFAFIFVVWGALAARKGVRRDANIA
jgi:hypothetical protein